MMVVVDKKKKFIPGLRDTQKHSLKEKYRFVDKESIEGKGESVRKEKGISAFVLVGRTKFDEKLNEEMEHWWRMEYVK